MITNLKNIDQQGVKSLLRERLEHPGLYADKPLIIWRANLRDGIMSGIIREVFREYNDSKPTDKQRWYVQTSLGEGEFLNDDTTRSDFACEYCRHRGNKYPIGMYVIEPIYAMRDYESSPHNYANREKYHSAINTRRFEGIDLQAGVPVVVFMDYINDDDVDHEMPEYYPDAEHYMFCPDYEQFENWAVANKALPRFVLDFIRGDGNIDGITYRWYNYYNNSYFCNTRKGCDSPGRWMIALDRLAGEMKESNMTKLSEMDDLIFRKSFPKGISEDVIDEFRQYVLKHDF